MHGRRSFVGISSKFETSFESWSWAFESMKNFHFNAIIFASDDYDLIGAISKPSSWPSLKFYSSHLLAWLQDIVDWKVSFLINILSVQSSLLEVWSKMIFINLILMLVFHLGLATFLYRPPFLYRPQFDWCRSSFISL